MNILDNYKSFCKNEVKEFKDILETKEKDNTKYAWVNPKEAYGNAIQRCLGGAFLCQSLGGEFDDVDLIYCEAIKELEKIYGKGAV